MLSQLSLETAYRNLGSAILINDCLPASCDDLLTLVHTGGDIRTKVNQNVVMHLSFVDPFAIFTFCKPSFVGSTPISITQKLYSPLLRANEEIDPAFRGSAFRESSHRTFRIVAACSIKFLLELRLWNGLRRAATAFEIFPCFQIHSAEMLEDFDYKCEEIGVFDGCFSVAQEPLYISFMQFRCESILDPFFSITFAEQPSSYEALAKWFVYILILSYYDGALRCLDHLG